MSKRNRQRQPDIEAIVGRAVRTAVEPLLVERGIQAVTPKDMFPSDTYAGQWVNKPRQGPFGVDNPWNFWPLQSPKTHPYSLVGVEQLRLL